MLERMRRKGNPSALLMGMQTGVATVENCMEFPQKKKRKELTFDPVIPPLGIYPKKLETPIQKNIYSPIIIAVLLTIAKIWKQSKSPSVDEWIKKLMCIYTMEYYGTVQMKEILLFVTAWMDLEITMLSEISQSVEDKYHMISLIICRI